MNLVLGESIKYMMKSVLVIVNSVDSGRKPLTMPIGVRNYFKLVQSNDSVVV